nr:cytochrome P450 4NU1 [Phenacoccus solenopsis]
MIVISIILCSILFLVYEKYSKIKKTNVPGPKCIPLFGNALEFLKKEDAMYVLYRLTKQYGNIYRFWLCNDLYFMLTNPKDIEVLINSYKHILKAVSYKYVSSWLGNGLITSYGETWRTHRKLLTPTFHFKILESSVGVIHKNATILKNILAEKVDAGEFDVHHYIEKCSLDIISETAMGIDMKVQTSNSSHTTSYLNAVKNVTDISVSRIFKAWLQPEILFYLSGYRKQFQDALHIMENITTKVITSRRQELLEKNVSSNCEFKNKPFLDFLLTESQFTDDEIQDEVKSFMFAGHDTTTSAICFCISQIAKYPEVQEKIFEEVMQVFPDENSDITIQNLNNLRYMENVIKETLRLFPSVPMIGRTILEDVILPSGHKLPANSNINIFIYGIQRNPEIFKNPEEFIPERFEGDEVKKYPYAFIPFSAGPRNCIGQRLAMMEIKIILITLIRDYCLLASEKLHSITLSSKLLLRSNEGIPIELKKRIH